MPLAAFDFDNTIIDTNSDIFINKILLEKESLVNNDQTDYKYRYPDEIENYKCWTVRMNGVFNFLHSKYSITQSDYVECLKQIRIDDSMKQLLNLLHSKGYHMIILSDANTFFIETILKENQLDHLFTAIFTNKSNFTQNGCLVVQQFNETFNIDGKPFNCSTGICAENICKGEIIQDYLKSIDTINNNLPVVYVGDGSNDFCPGRFLNKKDLYCVRKGYSLQKLLSKNDYLSKINSNIIYWKNANDILSYISKST